MRGGKTELQNRGIKMSINPIATAYLTAQLLICCLYVQCVHLYDTLISCYHLFIALSEVTY